MINLKKSLFLAALLFVTLSIMVIPVFAQQIYTYKTSDGLIADVAFLGSNVNVAQGGIIKNFTFMSQDNSGGYFYTSADNWAVYFSSNLHSMTLGIGSKPLYTFYLITGTSGYNGNINSGNNSGSTSYNNPKTLCYTCHGTGICPVCHGSGTYSNYGYSSPCTACGQTGKCWHCHGSGFQ